MGSVIKLVLLDLGGKNKLNYPFLASFSPGDLRAVSKVENLLVKHFGRAWKYVGAKKPYPPGQEFIEDLKKADLSRSEREFLLKFAGEKEMPIELILVSDGMDPKEFHDHCVSVGEDFQIEQYIVLPGKSLGLEVVFEGEKHNLIVKGPAVVFVGDIPHRQSSGRDCFVVKFPSGNFKRTYKDEEHE